MGSNAARDRCSPPSLQGGIARSTAAEGLTVLPSPDGTWLTHHSVHRLR